MTRNAALRNLASGLELALTSIRQLLEMQDPDEWVEQTRSPFGKRKHCELARRGAFSSARKLEGRWYVRRRDIDAYIEERGTPPPKTEFLTEAEADAEIMAFRAPRRRRR
jgi:hypothetical protein